MDYKNSTTCEVCNILLPQSGQYKTRTMPRLFYRKGTCAPTMLTAPRLVPCLLLFQENGK